MVLEGGALAVLLFDGVEWVAVAATAAELPYHAELSEAGTMG